MHSITSGSLSPANFSSQVNRVNPVNPVPAELVPHADEGVFELTPEQVFEYYPIVPNTVAGTVYMLHPLRFLTPEGNYAFLQHLSSRWPNIKRFCRHCFAPQDEQICSTPCANVCGCCHQQHASQPVRNGILVRLTTQTLTKLVALLPQGI